MGKALAKLYEDYILAGEWLCERSGVSHLWRPVEGYKRLWICIYCLNYKCYPASIYEMESFNRDRRLRRVYTEDELPELLDAIRDLSWRSSQLKADSAEGRISESRNSVSMNLQNRNSRNRT